MTPSRPRYLLLLAWVVALVSPLLIAPAVAQIDYDSENNGYIDITTLAQLNAIRWDLDGNGVVAAGNTANYNAAFPNAATGMGCPSSGCVGYELKADLDFDTNDDNVVDANDSPSFPAWNPIGTHTNRYTAEFKGNNRTISNLTITTHQNHWRVGLFDTLSPTAVVTGVGLLDVNLNIPAMRSAPASASHAGALAGFNEGTIRSSYSTGSVSAGMAPPGNLYTGGLVGTVNGGTIAASWSSANVSSTGRRTRGGGLVGQLGWATNGGTLTASYATGSVTAIGGASSTVRSGGLVGYVFLNASLTASYAAGPVSATGTTTHIGGLYGQLTSQDGAVTIASSYWDTATSGIDDDADGDAPEGKSTSELQSPRGYTGIYAGWNVNVDGIEGPDDPWDFGTANQYPMIKFDRQPLSQVQGVSVKPVGLNALVVSWTAVSDATGYKVQWKSGAENYDATDRQAIVTAGTTYTIPNLCTYTEYTVRVIATRTKIPVDGPASDEVTGTPGESGAEPEPDTEPVFIEAADPQTYRQNQAIEFTLPAAIDGNGTLTYTLTDLPKGLTFDAETLVVSGTPSEMTEKAIYTLTVTDADGDVAEMSFFITVLANVAPSFGNASVAAQSYLRKSEIESMTLPQASGGDGSLTYALTPDLPNGLKFDAETLMLSGTPLEAMGETTYTLTATDGDGDAATLMFTLEVMADPMPIFADTTLTAEGYQHRESEPLTLPQASGGDEPLTYALTPDLPEGLTFNAETRTISGTPTEAMDETTYTLTATDGNGDEATLMFTLEVPDLMPTFGDTTIAAQSYFVNVQTTSPRALPEATGGDGMVVYILLPFLPEGLSFDSDTRTIVGTPTEVAAEATYTYSALDADGDVASLTFTLDVRMPSSDFNGDGQVNFADFILLVGKYGFALGEDGYDARYDLDADGQIDVADFLIFAASFGATG